MLWNRSRGDATTRATATPALSSVPPSAPRDTAQEDDAIDTVVSILRSLGRHQFDAADPNVADVARLYELWAAHLSIGGVHPDQAVESSEDGRPILPKERDWPGARRFVQSRREEEVGRVTKTVGRSHDLIWDLTDKLAKSVLVNKERDQEVLDQLEQLRQAIATGSFASVEQAVNNAATLLSGAIKEREAEVKTQLQELGTRVSELSEQLQEVRVESRLDGLTRVANRADFDRAVHRWHHVGSAFGRPTCLMLVDVDHLKQINDKFGHRGGDAALRVFADVLVRCFPRRSDFVGRFGGDEFVVLLAETPATPGLRLAERFRQTLRTTGAEHDGLTIQLTASIGLAQLEPDENIESWLERADQALYAAKQNGRDQVAFARPADRPAPVQKGTSGLSGSREAAG
ncbi:MAG: diguanylate cyclase [Chloroflexota bacterium]